MKKGIIAISYVTSAVILGMLLCIVPFVLALVYTAAGAVYLSMNMLPEKVGTVLKCLPILHGTSLMRKLCCEDILATTFSGLPEELLEEYQEAMGITVVMGDSVVSDEFQVAFLLICGIIALGIAATVSMRRKAAER